MFGHRIVRILFHILHRLADATVAALLFGQHAM